MKNKVKVRRTELGFSQSKMAEDMGVSRQTMHAIETGKYVPSTVLALKLAHLLKLGVQELFSLEEGDWQ